jgi:hypothetical protein
MDFKGMDQKVEEMRQRSGPGSGNHWSDAFRSESGNFLLMSPNAFISHYGYDRYNSYIGNYMGHETGNITIKIRIPGLGQLLDPKGLTNWGVMSRSRTFTWRINNGYGGISFRGNLYMGSNDGLNLNSGLGGYDIDKAVNYVNSNAYSPEGPNKFGKGQCSPFVPKAINVGFGDDRIPTNLAGSAYGPSLLRAGFTSVPVLNLANYSPLKGDIAVMNGPLGGRTCNTGIGGPCGHIQMYNGEKWLSDFFQTRKFWPGSAYENTTPQLEFKIYRWLKQ